MKKNLFGAVAAGLALALAITSFGCESGNDDPIARPTDADLAGVLGSKFEFVATPTKYTATGTPVTEAETEKGQLYVASTGYSYNKVVNGVVNYNIKTVDSWGKADKASPKVGDVIKTEAETITLNAKDNTFEYGASSSDYAVKELYWTSTGAEPTTDKAAYDTITATYTGTTPTADEVNTALSAAKTNKTAKDAALADAQDAWNKLSPSAKKTQTDAKAGTEYDALEAAKTAATAAANQFEWLTVWKEGARYSILDTKTVNGATTGSLIYYAPKDGKINATVVKNINKAGGTAKATATGSYKVLSGNYLTGTILVTKFVKGDDTYVFDDDNDHYTLNGLEVYSSKISTDFDTQSTTKGKSTFNKAGRTLSIANKTLTSAKIETNNSTVTEAANKTYAFLLGNSENTAKDAYKEGTKAPATGEKVYASSYSYICK